MRTNWQAVYSEIWHEAAAPGPYRPDTCATEMVVGLAGKVER
jgi:hypothetical protein